LKVVQFSVYQCFSMLVYKSLEGSWRRHPTARKQQTVQ
jgi:hypothetical protein